MPMNVTIRPRDTDSQLTGAAFEGLIVPGTDRTVAIYREPEFDGWTVGHVPSAMAMIRRVRSQALARRLGQYIFAAVHDAEAWRAEPDVERAGFVYEATAWRSYQQSVVNALPFKFSRLVWDTANDVRVCHPKASLRG